MTIDQLKERIEATCNKNGIFDCRIIDIEIMEDSCNLSAYIEFEYDYIKLVYPNTDLLLEAVDLECRAIKARQGIATNGLDL